MSHRKFTFTLDVNIGECELDELAETLSNVDEDDVTEVSKSLYEYAEYLAQNMRNRHDVPADVREHIERLIIITQNLASWLLTVLWEEEGRT